MYIVVYMYIQLHTCTVHVHVHVLYTYMYNYIKYTHRSTCTCTYYIHILVRQHKEELREIKKKKAQKKLARSQEVEQHRETEKQRWKNFTTKVTNRSILLVQYSIYSHAIFFYMSVCVYVCMYMYV